MSSKTVIDESKVKKEIEDDFFGTSTSTSALDQMVNNFDENQEDEEEEIRISLELEEVKHRKKKKNKTENGEASGSKKTSDSDYLQKGKVELKTFGRSSRPRRSVNYASIERGDEATSQSLTKEFGSGKKRPKRTRDELDENYEEDEEKKGKKKVTKKTPSIYVSQNQFAYKSKFFEQTVDLIDIIPTWDSERPRPDERHVATIIDGFIGVRRASGGFRRFISWMTDSLIEKITKFIEENYVVTCDELGFKRIQSMRHAWNLLTRDVKRKWEKAARMDAFESSKLINSISMPLSEIPVGSVAEKNLKRFPLATDTGINCCSMRPTFKNVPEAVEHFMAHHDAVHLYGCNFCATAFTNKPDLINHVCDGFNGYLMSLTMSNETVTMKSAYFFLSCADCGFWLPLRMRAGHKCWPYFLAALFAHSCKSLVPCMIYFPEMLKDDELGIRMKLSLFPRVDCGLPISCQKCGVEEFKSVADINSHFKKFHPEQVRECFRCKETSGTEYLHRIHMVRHFNESLLFANYLRYSATYHPPPESKRNMHYGFEKEHFLVGGLDENISLTMCCDKRVKQDFVNVDENAIKQKFRNCLNEAKNESSRSVTPIDSDHHSYFGSTKVGPRSDLGYEHICYDEVFDDSKEGEEAKKRVEAILGNDIFELGEVLLNPKNVLNILKEDELKKEKFEFEIRDNSLLADISEKFSRIIKLPLSSCVDPLKDFLLLNKCYNYCEKCKTIMYSDIEIHAKRCGVAVSDIRELFHAASSPDVGIRCIEPTCDVRTCSVIGLRCHATLVHGQFIEFETINKFTRYDFSLQALSINMDYLKHDQRTRMARFTDIDMGMPISGVFEQKALPYRNSYKLKELTPERTIKLIKPFVLPRFVTYDCVWCQFNAQDLQEFKAHITSLHIHYCENCGLAFGSKMKKMSHLCRKLHKQDLSKVSLTLFGTCQLCRCRFTMSMLHAHTIRAHFDDVQFNQNSGELLPSGIDIRLERRPTYAESKEQQQQNQQNQQMVGFRRVAIQKQMDRTKLIRTDFSGNRDHIKNGVQFVPQPNGSYFYEPPSVSVVDLRMSCYLCQMGFMTAKDLDEHLSKHPEQWSSCPFCKSPVGGHYDMQKHLLQTHMIRSSQSIICEFCRQTSITNPCSHLIYECKNVPNCPICAVSLISGERYVKHMAESHGDVLRRFQCTLCAQIFITMRSFYEHVCNILTSLQSCACDSSVTFRNVSDFCDHFDKMHVEDNFVCGVCRVPQMSYGALARHRNFHMQPVATAKFRKVYILPKWLHPSTPQKSPLSVTQNGNGSGKVSNAMVSTIGRIGNPIRATRVRCVERVDSSPTVGDVLRNKQLTMLERLNLILETAEPTKPSTSTFSTNGRMPIRKVIVPNVEHSRSLIRKRENDDEGVEVVFEKSPTTTKIIKKQEPSPSVYDSDEPPPLEMIEDHIQAPVRVESAETSESGGKNQPGYVADDGDDDDDDVMVENVVDEKVRDMTLQSKLTEIIDENGDDELAVVAEVENGSGFLSSTIASSSREKKFKCNKCSSSFITKSALTLHLSTHGSDAGVNTSSETFGVPIESIFYICRNCCLAFESPRKHSAHIAVHGNTQMTCRRCSGIGFNSAIMQQHFNGHNLNKIFYACGTCRIKFSSDSLLMEHLSKSHKVVLLFFCKHCGYGSTNLNKVFVHCSTTHGTDYTVVERIGACPASLCNYEPEDPKKYKELLAHGRLSIAQPSDCAHRSMLLVPDVLVSCKLCHCTQSLHSYIALNKGLENSAAFALSTTEQNRSCQFPFISYLNRMNAETVKINGQYVPKPINERSVYTKGRRMISSKTGHGARIILPVQDQIASAVSEAVSLGGAGSTTTTTSGAAAATATAAGRPSQPSPPNVSKASSSTQVVTSSSSPRILVSHVSRPNGKKLVATRVAPLAPAPSTTTMMMTKPSTSSTSTLSSPENRTFEERKRNSSGIVPSHSIDKCKVCHAELSTEFDRLKHQMHKELEQSWFCGMCAYSEKSEMEMMRHYYRKHMIIYTPAHSFKPVIYDLKCPFVECRTAPAFNTMKSFEKHLQLHSRILPHKAEACSCLFATKLKKNEHEQKHADYEQSYGVEANCCPLCGTLDMWTMPKLDGSPLVLSHISRHGLDYFSSCRICLNRFADDSNFLQLWEHFKTEHIHQNETDGQKFYSCECGQSNIPIADGFKHLSEKHAFNVIRRAPSAKLGELVIRAGNQLLNFMGIRKKVIVTRKEGGNRLSTNGGKLNDNEITTLD